MSLISINPGSLVRLTEFMMHSKRHLLGKAVEPDQWLERHPEAGSS